MPMSIVPILCQARLKNEIDVLKHSYSLFQACVKMKQVTLSSVYSWFQAC